MVAREYVPVRVGTPIERVLVVHFTATFALSDLLTHHGRETAAARRDDARRFVQRLWGAQPELEARFGFRQMLHAQLLGCFFVSGLVSAGLIALGRALDAPLVLSAGAFILLLSCVPLGAHGPVAVRTISMELDARAWAAAGRPASWAPRPSSQLGSVDLLWAIGLALVWATFFFVLLRSSL